MSEDRKRRKTRVGTVISDKQDNTITVAIETRVRHRLYKKTIRRTKKFHADDPKNEAQVGDTVSIMETKPLSKTKCWRLVEIVERAERI